jgi:hypothetical protein
MNLRDTLQQIHKTATTLKNRQASRKTPENLIIGIALPLCQALGYNIFDSEETETENLPTGCVLLKTEAGTSPAIFIHCIPPGSSFSALPAAVTKSIHAATLAAEEKKAPILVLTTGEDFQVHVTNPQTGNGELIPAFTFSTKSTLAESLGKLQMLAKDGFNPKNIHALAVSETRIQTLQQAFHRDLVNPSERFFQYAASLLGLTPEESNNEEFRQTAGSAYKGFFRRMITRRLEEALEQHLEETKPQEPEIPEIKTTATPKENKAPAPPTAPTTDLPKESPEPPKVESETDAKTDGPAESETQTATPETEPAAPEAAVNPDPENNPDPGADNAAETADPAMPGTPEEISPDDIFQKVRTLLADSVDGERLSLKENASYYAVILDKGPKSRVCRIYNNLTEGGYKITHDNTKPQISIKTTDELDEHKEKFTQALSRLLTR